MSATWRWCVVISVGVLGLSACSHGGGGVIVSLGSPGDYVICRDITGETVGFAADGSITGCQTVAKGSVTAKTQRVPLPMGDYRITFTPVGLAGCHDQGSFAVQGSHFSNVYWFGSLC